MKLSAYPILFETQRLDQQAEEFLQAYHCEYLMPHLLAVAKESEVLAKRFDEDPQAAYQAGILHDISVVIPDQERIAFHEDLGLSILPEERVLPMILHQQQSALLAEECFHITDQKILTAISCHTTLKAAPKKLEMIVFLADKIRWDRSGTPPFLAGLQNALTVSLSDACLYYLDWLFSEDLLVPHPWAVSAREELRFRVGIN